MLVYLSGPDAFAANALAERLKKFGHTVLSNWHHFPDPLPGAGTEAADWITHSLNFVRCADSVVYVGLSDGELPADVGRFADGCLEFGYGLALGKRCGIVGALPGPGWWYKPITRIADFDGVLTWLKQQ